MEKLSVSSKTKHHNVIFFTFKFNIKLFSQVINTYLHCANIFWYFSIQLFDIRVNLNWN